MYGLVNVGVKDMVIDAGGEALWETVRTRAGVMQNDFARMQPYDDALTASLVQAASEALDTPSNEILKGFGRHWIKFTGSSGYGPMMDVAGDTLEEFLANLDQMHARIKISMPKLEPPMFDCKMRDDNVIEVAYFSTREGLAPMVTGLLEGLVDRFEEIATVVHVKAKQAIDDPDLFEVRLGATT